MPIQIDESKVKLHDLLTIHEAADKLGKSYNLAFKLVTNESSKVRTLRKGGQIFVLKEDIEKIADERKKNPPFVGRKRKKFIT